MAVSLTVILSEIDQCYSSLANEAFIAPLGAELECFVFEDGKPVDLTLARNREVLREMPGVWSAGTDLGKNMLEIAFNPAGSIYNYLDMLHTAFAYLAARPTSSRWEFVFGENPDTSLGMVTSNPRYPALVDAFVREYPRRGHLMRERMIRYAAFQVNIGVRRFGGIYSGTSKRLLFALNNWAPAVALIFQTFFGDPESERISQGYDFLIPARGVRYVSLEECNNLDHTLRSIPQLVEAHGDSFRYAGYRPSLITPLHTGTIYWLARPQGIGDPDAERIEFRPLDTLRPEHSVRAMWMVNRLVRAFLRSVELPIISPAMWEVMVKKTDKKQAIDTAYRLMFRLKIPISW